MCVMSMVHDHFSPKIPDPNNLPWIPITPQVPPGLSPLGPNQALAAQLAELAKLIKDFREATAAAKKVDELTAQPNCGDPQKAKLEERVAELERRLAVMEKWRSG